MNITITPIRVGQRFRQDDGQQREQVVTISRLTLDPHGLPQVVFALPDGREICTYAMQIEAALADGSLVPDHEVPLFAGAELQRLAS